MQTQTLVKFVIIAVAIAGAWLGSSSGVLAQDAQEDAVSSTGYLTYRLEPGDVITVSIWKSDELGATVPIRPDGKISMPLIGEVTVHGKTPEEIRGELAERYQEFVTAPSVSVVVDQINSWKVFVLGEVQSPGAFDVLKSMTLLQMLAMAGGLTEFAKKDEIVVLRNEGPTEKRRVLSMKAITSGRDLSQNIVLRPGDTVVVP